MFEGWDWLTFFLIWLICAAGASVLLFLIVNVWNDSLTLLVLTPILALGITFIPAKMFAENVVKTENERSILDQNTDPRRGYVLLQNGGWKECDGTTLLYKSPVRGGASVSAVPNSPECAPK